MAGTRARIEVHRGGEPGLSALIPELARLRIEVFRDFPYLYDGTLAYEEHYLVPYFECPESVLVLARAEEGVVGASTGLPLDAATEEWRAPFLERGIDPATVFYCGESVLRRPYRGLSLYPRFFAEREAHARALGRFRSITFAAVERPDDHPARPSRYAPLDKVWNRFGYRRDPALRTEFSWQDVGDAAETRKPMVFWTKAL